MLRAWHKQKMRRSFALLIAFFFVLLCTGFYFAQQQYPPFYSSPAAVAAFHGIYSGNLAVDKAIYGDQSLFQARDENGLAFFEMAQNRQPQAYQLLKNSLNIREGRRGPYDPAVYRSLQHLARYYDYVDDPKSCREVLERSLDVAIRSHWDGDQIPQTMSALAFALHNEGNYKEERRYLQFVKQWYELHCARHKMRDEVDRDKEDTLDLAVALYELADFHGEFNDKTTALAYAENADRLLATQSAEQRAKIIEKNPQLHVRILARQGRIGDAIRFAKERIAVPDQKLMLYPEQSMGLELAKCYRAEHDLTEAANLNRKVLADGQGPPPMLPRYQRSAHFQLGLIALEQRKFEEAASELKICGEFRPAIQYLKAAQEHRVPTDLSGCIPVAYLREPPPAVRPNAIGISAVIVEPYDRIDIYNDAVTYFETKLRKNSSAGPEIQAKILSQLGDAYAASRKSARALESYKKAVDLLTSAGNFGLDYVVALDAYACVLQERDAEKAYRLFREASRRAEAFSRQHPLLMANILIHLSADTVQPRTELLKRALQLQQKELGTDNVVVARTLFKLAHAYATEGSRTASAEAAKKRAAEILTAIYVNDFKKFGPLSEQVLNDSNTCEELDVPGFSSDSTKHLAILQLMYGENDPGNAKAMLEEANMLESASAPDPPARPNLFLVAIPILFLLGFALIFIFVQRTEAADAERPSFQYGRKWNAALLTAWMFCLVLIAGEVCAKHPESAANWRHAKQIKLAQHAVTCLRKYDRSSDVFAKSTLQLAGYYMSDHRLKDAESCYQEGAATLEQNDVDKNRWRLVEVYNDLASVMEEEGKQDESKAMKQKAFELQRSATEPKPSDEADD